MKKLLTFFLTALLAFSVGWADPVTDFINRDFTGVASGAGYSDWSGKTSNSDAVYAGNSAGGNDAIQLRYTNQNSGIITTSSGGKVKSIEVTWNTSTNNARILWIYGKNTPYSSPTELFSSDASVRGTQIAEVKKSDGNVQTVSVTGDYEYIGFRSTDGALYLTSLEITWESGGSTVETCATPTFSPAAGTFTEAQNVTISTTTDGASIYYTTDGSTPSSTTGTLYTGAINVSSTTTIKAIAVKSGNNDSQVAEATYTIISGGDLYTLVTDVSSLSNGDNIIFVNSGSAGAAYAMSTTQNTNNRGTTGVSVINVNGTMSVAPTSNTEVFTLETGWYFRTHDDRYIYAASNTANHLKTHNATENSLATISIASSGIATIEFQGDYSHNVMQFNGTSLVSCYETASQSPVYIYRKAGASIPKVATPTFSPAEGTYTEAQNVTISTTTSGADIYYTTDGTEPSSTNGTLYTGAINVSSTTTIKAIAVKSGYDDSNVATATYTINLIPVVTVSPSSLNINDSGTNNTFTVTAINLANNDNGNVGVSALSNEFGLSFSSNTNQIESWGFRRDNNNAVNGTVAVSYNGRALSATTTVTASTQGDSKDVTVNYVADLYVVTDNGVTGDWHFDGTYGVPMTNNDGVYTAVFTAENPNTFILFARKLGEGVNWNTRYVFGPVSDNDWELPASGNGNGDIDLNDDDPIKIQGAGTYIITINANTGAFTITKRVLTGDEFVLVTNTEDVTTDSEYVLVYSDIAAMGKTLSSTTSGYLNHETTGFEVEVDVVTLTSDSEVNVFTLIAVDEYFYILDSNGKYIGTNGNNLTLSDEANGDAFKWSITIDNDLAIMKNKANNRYLAYNTSSPRFNTYASIAAGSAQQCAALYKRGGTVGPVAPHAPVITPASGNYTEDQEVTITCSTPGATIYYTVNGGETQTYTAPFIVDFDDNNTEVTIVAWAEKDDLTSGQVTVTYTYKNDKVNSIAEFLALENGDEATFSNPVIVLFDYSQNSSGGQEYIWVKDRTGYTQLFITPQFDASSVADPQYSNYGNFVPKYENGDVIPAGFKVKKNYYETGQYYQAKCTDTHSTFQTATDKALADPEQVTLSELLVNPANYNNRYLYINKLQVSDVNGLSFNISADENGDNVSEVQGGTTIVGYNKYNSPAWKNKQGDVVGVTLPTDNNYYNVKFIFQKWSNGYEIMPIEFTEWQDNSVRLEDLVETGVVDNDYTISNDLIAAVVTWDDNKKQFAIFAKDDEMYANKRYPTDGMDSYLIEYANQDSTFINDVPQELYDQSNWIEILIPSTINDKGNNDYSSELSEFKTMFEGKILAGGSISGKYKDALNPTIQMSQVPSTPTMASAYAPNYYCTGNFLMENLDADGAQSYRDDELAGGSYFMMDAKPQEYCKVIWAYFEDNSNYFVAPEREGDLINGLRLHGSFLADMSLCEDQSVTAERTAQDVFAASNSGSGNTSVLYGFRAIVRKNSNSTVWSGGSNGAPSRIAPFSDGMETPQPAYIVYPLEGQNSSENVTDVEELLNVNNKTVVSVHYYNMMGMESRTPFDGINVVVTRYSDGSTSTLKVIK